MKTTLEIPAPLFRRAKALAARKGIPRRQLVREALLEKVEGRASRTGVPAWHALAGGLSDLRTETARILERIEADAETVDAEDA